MIVLRGAEWPARPVLSGIYEDVRFRFSGMIFWIRWIISRSFLEGYSCTGPPYQASKVFRMFS